MRYQTAPRPDLFVLSNLRQFSDFVILEYSEIRRELHRVYGPDFVFITGIHISLDHFHSLPPSQLLHRNHVSIALDRKVALKILPQHLSDRAELRERFEREARAVSSLNPPPHLHAA